MCSLKTFALGLWKSGDLDRKNSRLRTQHWCMRESADMAKQGLTPPGLLRPYAKGSVGCDTSTVFLVKHRFAQT